MKSTYNIRWIGPVLLLALAPFWAFAKQDFTKTIKKEFEISSDGITSISNRYGRVEVKTWDKNRVKIDVTIVVKAGSESEAQKVFDRIQVNFANTAGTVSAETSIESQKNTWWGSWNSSRTDFSINYDVFVPTTGTVELANKYGDLYLAPYNGKANIEVKYGNCRLEGLNGPATLALAYGNGSIGQVKQLQADAQYCRLLIKEARDLQLDSKYSKITVDQCETLRCETRYDTYSIGAVKDLTNSGKYDNFEVKTAERINIMTEYTDLSIGKIQVKADLNLKYGGASIQDLARGFDAIVIQGKYADFKVGMNSGIPYRIDFFQAYAGIRYPEGMKVTLEKERGTSHQVEGHSGSSSEGGVIKAKLAYGGLKVQQN